MKLWALVHSNALGDLCSGPDPRDGMKDSFVSGEKPVKVPRCCIGIKNEWARVTKLETEVAPETPPKPKARVQIGKGGCVGDGE